MADCCTSIEDAVLTSYLHQRLASSTNLPTLLGVVVLRLKACAMSQ